MSHDIKKYKLLKKIVGILGYKLIDKSSAKTERLIDNFTLKIEIDFLNLIKLFLAQIMKILNIIIFHYYPNLEIKFCLK